MRSNQVDRCPKEAEFLPFVKKRKKKKEKSNITQILKKEKVLHSLILQR